MKTRHIVLLATAATALVFLFGCTTTETSRVSAGAPPEAAKKTLNLPAFDSESAESAPSLKEGGFAEEPAFMDDFNPDWERTQKDWQVANWLQNGTQMARSRCRTNEDGYLVQTVLPGEPYRGGSLQTTREFGYGRWLARVKPSSVSGSLHSIFTKDWDDLETEVPHDGRKAEVDIEFLTYTFRKDRGQVHLAIHLLNHRPLWHADVDLDFNPSAAFNVWGFDILPDRVVWHVNGKIIHTWMYTDEYYIDPDYEMMFNSWTRDIWIKGPPSENADYLIDWVKFHPYEGD